jgi:hypothetical protein
MTASMGFLSVRLNGYCGIAATEIRSLPDWNDLLLSRDLWFHSIRMKRD